LLVVPNLFGFWDSVFHVHDAPPRLDFVISVSRRISFALVMNLVGARHFGIFVNDIVAFVKPVQLPSCVLLCVLPTVAGSGGGISPSVMATGG
jgi:hypothetical protein